MGFCLKVEMQKIYMKKYENELNKYTVNCRKKKFDSLEEYCSELLKIYDI